jgi:circadian clock protein KaiC
VDPAELSPGEFASQIRRAVDVDKATVIVIDSLNGYLNATPDERFLTCTCTKSSRISASAASPL